MTNDYILHDFIIKMLRIGRFTETERRLVVAKRWSGWGKMGMTALSGVIKMF